MPPLRMFAEIVHVFLATYETELTFAQRQIE